MVTTMAMAMTITTDMKLNPGAIPMELAAALAVPMATMAIAPAINLGNAARALSGGAVFYRYAAKRCGAGRRSDHSKSDDHCGRGNKLLH